MLKYHFLQFLAFVKNPNDFDYPSLTPREKVSNTLIYFSRISFFGGLTLGLIAVLLAEVGLINMPENKFDYGYVVFLLGGVIVAPILEECIFRGFLSSIKNKKSFKWFYYISSVLFGLVHVFNYENSEDFIYTFWLVTSAQIFIGLLFGYLRVTYGLWYAILLHAVHNFVILNFSYLTEFITEKVNVSGL